MECNSPTVLRGGVLLPQGASSGEHGGDGLRAHASGCSRSAAASPATACARRSTSSPSTSRSRAPRCRAARRCFDWTVPRRVEHPRRLGRGARRRRASSTSADSNLHVVGYSEPVRRDACRSSELREHLHTLPEQPDLIPYRTSYYARTWGFCLPHRRLGELEPTASTRWCIDSTLGAGHLTYGELRCSGRAATSEVLISTYVCHPSLANDNLSGIAVATMLGEGARRAPRCATRYRFVFAPGTIGSIDLAARRTATRSTGSRTGSSSPASATPAASPTSAAGAATRRRPRRRARAARLGRAVRGARLRALGRRRAPVLLARLRPAGRLADAHAARRLPRVPHLRRRPGPHLAGVARGGRAARASTSSTCSRRTGTLRQPQPVRRAAARQARALPLGRRRGRSHRTTSARCCGCST